MRGTSRYLILITSKISEPHWLLGAHACNLSTLGAEAEGLQI